MTRPDFIHAKISVAEVDALRAELTRLHAALAVCIAALDKTDDYISVRAMDYQDKRNGRVIGWGKTREFLDLIDELRAARDVGKATMEGK